MTPASKYHSSGDPGAFCLVEQLWSGNEHTERPPVVAVAPQRGVRVPVVRDRSLSDRRLRDLPPGKCLAVLVSV